MIQGQSTLELTCAVCEKTCANFSLDIEDDKLKYEGLTGQTYFPAIKAVKAFDALRNKNVKLAHEILSPSDNKLFEGIGIDCYCPKCDKTYCSTHYVLFEVRDSRNFYDKTLGTCPNGHERKLDD